jgi:hypothetical protein
MAIIKRGILGGFSNKIGNIVGSSWKGIAIMKSLPLSVANPRTTAQVNQRTKFTGVVKFASTLLSRVVKPLWDRFAQQESGYNAFIKANIENFNTVGELTNFTGFKMSEGKLSNVDQFAAVASAAADTVVCTWNFENREGPFDNATDEIFIIVYNASTLQILAQENAGPVSTETTTVRGDVFVSAQPLKIWYACRSADGTQVSNTGFLAVTSGS